MPSPDAIQVYKNNDHIFSYNCNETGSCNIYTTDIESPKYKMFDGEIQTNSHIKSLSISNIQSFKPFYWMDNQYIQFNYKEIYLLNLKIIEIPSIWIETKNRKTNFKVCKWLPYYIYWLFYSIIRNITKFFTK